jgi:hypothetical protein
MLKNDKWQNLVPKNVASLIKKWDGIARLKSIQESEK